MNGLLLTMLDWAPLVNWLTRNVHDTAKRSWSNRYHDGRSSISGWPPSNETLGTWAFRSVSLITRQSPGRVFTVHGNTSDHTFTQMLLSNSKPKSQVPHGVI